jgi:subtilisin family serine protease
MCNLPSPSSFSHLDPSTSNIFDTLPNRNALEQNSYSTQSSATPSKQNTPTKIDLGLANLYTQTQQQNFSDFASLQQSQNQINTAFESRFQISGDWITIDATAASDPTTLLNDLKTLGLRNAFSYGAIISGEIPITAIEQLTTLDSLQFVRPAYKLSTNIGRITSQADSSMRADIARSQYGVTGRGVKIGVLSDSFNALGGTSSDINSNDLPANLQILRDSPGTDEGRAMAQLIHDIAPDSPILFHTANGGEAAFARAILALADAGASVIVDDIIYLSEPMFQDGIIAQAIKEVTRRGVVYFSSAGNNGRDAYESAFTPSGYTFQGALAHDFNRSANVDIAQSISIAPDSSFRMVTQWDQPFYSLNPGSGGSRSDIDIYLVDDYGRIAAESTNDNLGKDPIEILAFTNNSASTLRLSIIITNAGGPNPSWMKSVFFRFDGTINEYDTESGSLYGHANATEAIAVGATPFYRTPAYGSNPAILEDFSSPGGTAILFDDRGQRLLRPDIRFKTDIVAPDGTNTTFFGRDITQDSDTFPNFFGTSAAAPHAAAVAALMRQANPTLSPTQIAQVLKNTALDMDDPDTYGFDTGFDYATGYGFIQADRAVAAVNTRQPILRTAQNLGTLTGTKTIRDSVSSSNTIDLYRFELNTSSNFSLLLNSLNADADVFLIRDFNDNGIIDSSDLLAASESLGTSPEAINLKNLERGIYFIAVQEVDGNTPYTLSLTGTP